MGEKEYQLYGLIREKASSGNVSFNAIYNYARIEGLIRTGQGKLFKKMILNIVREGKVRYDEITCVFTPILSEEEDSAKRNAEKGVIHVTDDLIKAVIRKFFLSHQRLPTPGEIDDYFRETIGIPDQKDLPRIVRFRIADGILVRDDSDGVSYPGMSLAEGGLRRFVA